VTYPVITFDLGLLPPGQMKMPRIMSGSIGGGSSASGITGSADISGGGFLAVDYANVQLGNANQSALRAWNRLAIALNGGVRPIVVPLLTDFIAPILKTDSPAPQDTSIFTDPVVTGLVGGAATVGLGQILVSVIGGTGILEGGEWFGLNHLTKSYRAYNVIDIVSIAPDGSGNNLYLCNIRPTLREALAGGETVDWYRPRCVMRIDPASPMEIDIEKNWWSTPSIKLVEYFGAL
jgi:hypothetical protein